ncbi:ATP-binding cassette domain-containing protein [Streptomyces sp. NPDC088246]|uniref:ATP-binding cassette domain-containing protein n=1 Tax=Streptomyces sp. NPDC088246 TaxID=3365842 RepID=UPI00381185A3
MAYGSRPAPGGLDLTVLPCERVALTGPNGAGKSTSLALVAVLYPPTLGSAAIGGRASTELPELGPTGDRGSGAHDATGTGVGRRCSKPLAGSKCSVCPPSPAVPYGHRRNSPGSRRTATRRHSETTKTSLWIRFAEWNPPPAHLT